MSWFRWFHRALPKSGRRVTSGNRQRTQRVLFEQLEDRSLPSAMADLVAFRPMTEYIKYANFPVSETDEADAKLGPGIRFNGDNDNGLNGADYLETTASAAENDLVRVDVVQGAGTSVVLTWTGSLVVWKSAAKGEAISSGATVALGQQLWVEYVSSAHTIGDSTALTLTAEEGGTTVQDTVVFHSFQSDVIAIGGNMQDPALVGDPQLGVFTIGLKLYQQGYDVHLYAYSAVNSTGKGAAFNEVKSAVQSRNVDNVAIFGYSWGGGATYKLASALKAESSLVGMYQLKYSAYIDGITQSSISAERRLPPGTQYHDNIYQRRDLLIKGNSVTGAVNLNVTNTTWGKSLGHTTIDDHLNVQTIILTNLVAKLLVS